MEENLSGCFFLNTVYFGECIVKLSLPWMRRRRIFGIECRWRNTSFHRTWLHR